MRRQTATQQASFSEKPLLLELFQLQGIGLQQACAKQWQVQCPSTEDVGGRIFEGWSSAELQQSTLPTGKSERLGGVDCARKPSRRTVAPVAYRLAADERGRSGAVGCV